MDVVFWNGLRVVPHDKLDDEPIDSVAITFSNQKNGNKFETITQDATDDDELCPVKHWNRVVQRIRAYPGFKEEGT